MRRKDRAIQDPKVLDAIMTQSNYVVLGLPGHEAPYLVPMNFGWHNQCLYMHSARAGRKIRMLQDAGGKLPVSAVLVGKADVYDPGHGATEITTHYASVFMEGTLEEVTTLQEARAGMQAILTQAKAGDQPFSDEALKSTAVLRLTPHTISGKQNPGAAAAAIKE
ncbi:pyridoxamine 5'-phosphate oxidase family protein [Desulfovibrio cuneatus]|uniref:pyridoxamine 5'-phosphate oxidase family protein n=1 Tax=Desulfovibrio cuneatus TaxID=159728 RepID=UPI0004090085|nr:pyridoxamine 5'-phosphate oxidase family protein [Desulfovibrio cuneatus]